VTVRARRPRARLVERLERAGEEEHRDVREPRIGLHRLADLVAVPPRHDDVREDDVGPELLRLRHRVLAVVDGGDSVVLVREGDAHDLLDRDRVVREEKVLGHGFPGVPKGVGNVPE
jgi:hypothetical protein